MGIDFDELSIGEINELRSLIPDEEAFKKAKIAMSRIPKARALALVDPKDSVTNDIPASVILDEKVRDRISKDEPLKWAYNGLLRLRTNIGMFRASPGSAYIKHSWHRDTLFCILPLLYENNKIKVTVNSRQAKLVDPFEQTIDAIMDRMKQEEAKIDDFIASDGQVPDYRRIDPKFDASSLESVFSGTKNEWGHIQDDANGQRLFTLYLGIKSGRENLLKDKHSFELLEKDIKYNCICILKKSSNPFDVFDGVDWDNGIWEERLKLNVSSIVPILSGLINIKSIYPKLNEMAKSKGFERDFILPDNIDDCIKKAKQVLHEIFTQRSKDKNTLTPQETPCIRGAEHLQRTWDLTLLSLIYPYGIADRDFAIKIVEGVEKNLLRERGVIRYIGDTYYNRALPKAHKFDIYPEGINNNLKYHMRYSTNYTDRYPVLGNEAEWCMGIPKLSYCCKLIAEDYRKCSEPIKAVEYEIKAQKYHEKAKSLMNEKGLPELFFSGSDMANINNPLAWADADFIISDKFQNNMIPEILKPKLLPSLLDFLTDKPKMTAGNEYLTILQNCKVS